MTQPKILIVDDEAGFTQLLKMNLERTGNFEVQVENDSRKALTVAVEFEPDVVLLDVSMPGLDGGEVAALFAEHPDLRNVPIIMLTALVPPNEEDPEAVIKAGDVSVLAKPISMGLLMKCIAEVLNLKESVGA